MNTQTFKQFLVESYDFRYLHKHRIPLTEEERGKINQSGASVNGESQIWKAQDVSTEIVYVTVLVDSHKFYGNPNLDVVIEAYVSSMHRSLEQHSDFNPDSTQFGRTSF